VGYSYCAQQKKLQEQQRQKEEDDDDGNNGNGDDDDDNDDDGGSVCQNTDKFTASASRAALLDFFTNKFPELQPNEFFITGESYAGVYIPTLSKEILDHNSNRTSNDSSIVVNLVGIAVGDPCTDNTAQQDSMDSLWYGNKYGLVDEQVYDLLWNTCWARFPNLMTRGGKHLVAAQLNQHVKEALLEKKKNHIRNSSSDLLEDKDMALLYARRLLEKLSTDPGPLFPKESEECRLAARKFLLSSSHGLSQGWSDLYIDDYSLFAPVTSREEDDMATYMMRDDVRAALHVQDAPSKSWPYADVGFDYTKEYDACNDEVKSGAWSMIDFYKDIIPRLKTTFIYNGNTDPCVSYEGTRTAVKRVGFAEVDGGSYRPWFYNQTAASIALLAEKAPLFGPNLLAQSMGAQLGGEVVNYEHGLSFLTVHGSGHMVPQFRPQAALHMLVKLLQKENGLLSPLLPSNRTLTGMDVLTFQDAMDDWTESAMAEPYVCSSSRSAASASSKSSSSSSSTKEDSNAQNFKMETAIQK
jgi:serine carboxypeptidase-like clade I